jgi:hypothetical protein
MHAHLSRLRCEVVRWVSDEPIPGWVEVAFTDAAGRRWSLFDKPPIFTDSPDLHRDTPLPFPIELDCEILPTEHPPGLVTISPLWETYFEDGRSEFIVHRSQLTPE